MIPAALSLLSAGKGLKFLVIAGIVAAVLGGTYLKGRSDGKANIQEKWDAAIAESIRRGNEAAAGAERDVQSGSVSDPFDRNHGRGTVRRPKAD